MKKIVAFLLMFSIFVFCLPQVAFANSPGPNLDGTYEPQPGWVIFIIVLYLVIIAFTCFVEWLVCIPFEMHYVYSGVIIATNVTTQIIMHFLQRLLMAVFSMSIIDAIACYILTVTILEVAVVISEFLIYRKKILGYSIQSLLLYVLSANAASAFGGILLLILIIF